MVYLTSQFVAAKSGHNYELTISGRLHAHAHANSRRERQKKKRENRKESRYDDTCDESPGGGGRFAEVTIPLIQF